MRKIILVAVLLSGLIARPAQAMTEQERRDYLDMLRRIILPVDATASTSSFDEWLQTSKQLPPDFDALPKQNGLPDPLKFLDGREVKTAADWTARRKEIFDLFQKYQLGTIPPKANLDKVTVVSETISDGVTPPPAGGRGPATPLPAGTVTRVVRLEYGPGSQASTQVTLVIPAGEGPFPVLIGGSGAVLLQRGYIACNYPNSVDTLTNLPTLYPTYDFATMAQQAFIAREVVDYLVTVPQVDKARIAIAGYSRGGKMAMTAAALDERIAAVLAGSTGVGGILSWRQGGERNNGESIESTTRMFPLWMARQLRFFSGREDRLPIDGNLLVALVAPRACLMEYGLNDEVSNTWGAEQTLHSVEPLYAMLGKPTGAGLLRLPGRHADGGGYITPGLDWLDIQFGRSQASWDNKLLFPWDLKQWTARTGEKVDLAKFPTHKPDELLTSLNGNKISTVAEWDAKVADIRKNITWMLGDEPSTIPQAGGPLDASKVSAAAAGAGRGAGAAGARGGPAAAPNPHLGASINPDIKPFFAGATSNEFGWIPPQRNNVDTHVVSIGEGLKGDLYYPTNTPPGTKLPTVIWLHGYSYPLGYMWVYRRDLHPILALAEAGYAVLAYDQIGFGGRLTEIGPFFNTAPHWSQMGRLVHDARAALDALAKDDMVDANRLYLYGYELGATVGLYTAALDTRVKGVVSVNGFTPMRTDTADKGTGGIARWSVERPLLPRLGFFIGHESQLPYDFQDVLGAIAPRPAIIVAPKFDRDATPAEVHAALDQVRQVYSLYNASANLMVDEPWDYARMAKYTQDWTIQSLNWTAKPTPPATPPASASTAAN